jgi:hypothetical protein
MVYTALLPLMRTPRLPVVDWTYASADLNGLVRFAERQNLVLGPCAITFQKQSTFNPILTVVAQTQKNVGVHMPLTRLLAGFRGEGWRGNLVRGEILRSHHQACHIRRFRNIDIELSYEYAPRSANIFERGVILPGRAEVNLAATAPCRLQLFALLSCYIYLSITVCGHTGTVWQHVASMVRSRLSNAQNGNMGLFCFIWSLPPEVRYSVSERKERHTFHISTLPHAHMHACANTHTHTHTHTRTHTNTHCKI